ncbi:uncharacterized protein O3C94_015325 [Discoglossus pictus]
MAEAMIPLHKTHVSNNYGEEVMVIVVHPNGLEDQIYVEHGKVRNVATEHGPVTVKVFNPRRAKEMVERRTIPSDISVVILKSGTGRPKILRVIYGKLWDVEPYDDGKI